MAVRTSTVFAVFVPFEGMQQFAVVELFVPSSPTPILIALKASPNFLFEFAALTSAVGRCSG